MSEVTVIIPMYNSEKTVERAIQSVQKQAFSDWTLLIVDDGSTDNGASICKQYAEHDSRIHILSEENHGSSYAVWNGIHSVKTPWTMFLDADDAYEPEMINTLYCSVVKQEADAARCGYYKIDENHNKKITLPVTGKIFSKDEINELILRPFFEEDANIYRNWSAARWDKIYSTALLKKAVENLNLFLPIGEDQEMALRYLKECRKIVNIGSAYYYNYYVSSSSLSHGYSQEMYNGYQQMKVSLQKTAEDLGYSFKAEDVLEDNNLLNMIFEVKHTANMSKNEKKKEIQSLKRQLHNKKNMYKLILKEDYPIILFLQKIRKIMK